MQTKARSHTGGPHLPGSFTPRQDAHTDSRTESDPKKNTRDTPWVSKYQSHRGKQYLTSLELVLRTL